jgi:hypothetical protein
VVIILYNSHIITKQPEHQMKKVYNISEHYNVFVAYGDASGLSDADEMAFNEWEKKVLTEGYYMVVADDQGWGRCDITGLDSDLIEVKLLPV